MGRRVRTRTGAQHLPHSQRHRDSRICLLLWQVASALLKAGADVRATDSRGWDALFAATHGGHTKLITVWLTRDDVERTAADGSTLLHVAAQGGRAAAARQLLGKGADPAARDARGNTPLDLARAGDRAEVVSLLSPISPPPRARRLAGGCTAGAALVAATVTLAVLLAL